MNKKDSSSLGPPVSASIFIFIFILSCPLCLPMVLDTGRRWISILRLRDGQLQVFLESRAREAACLVSRDVRRWALQFYRPPFLPPFEFPPSWMYFSSDKQNVSYLGGDRPGLTFHFDRDVGETEAGERERSDGPVVSSGHALCLFHAVGRSTIIGNPPRRALNPCWTLPICGICPATLLGGCP
ncbi:hypothetical protein QBC33DRAFT_227479 [Phialemonium atrogriseum]|uniref:Uncharacterized protein n=1 Tax=Phialemonium atrogriseum TaxID=1093897 RepID=A0AAJ0FQ82_9PEZI|nr:uncharacterized protein QBC33DRAFT_227479 [Phialemonium atrogriseum]KAK1771028.1 hypothetical protein QBC33DRAFT_227479 [Phialemonium atrogriseum]